MSPGEDGSTPAATLARRSVVLIVLDGWGYSSVFDGNAIAAAKTPNFTRLWKTYPHTLLQAAGEAVGLPWGEMGNSEVGHLNMGAGHVVPQDLPRISEAVADGSFFKNQALRAACAHAKTTGGTLHLVGLVSAGGVHSHIRHLFALLSLAKQEGLSKVAVHAYTDGRDAPVRGGKAQIEKLEQEMRSLGVGKIASVGGRYFSMDRDRHWERTKQAYDAILCGTGATAASAVDAVQAAYDADKTDEFIEPTVILEDGQPVATFDDADAVIAFNFRPDRQRQLIEAMVRSEFDQFDRGDAPSGMHVVTMTEYEKDYPVHVAFHPQNVKQTLAKVLADNGVRQFHIAETEKYPHATYFFNGGIEEPNPLEERLLVPSPSVATYDLAPAMSVSEIADEMVKKIDLKDYPFIMANFANADMVGHSGNFEATVQAVEAADKALGQVIAATDAAGSFLLVTADHGNAEEMLNFTSGDIDTEHTTNPVPFILAIPVGELSAFSYDESKLSLSGKVTPTGLLGDVAPTVLKILEIPAPDSMAGYGLF